MDETAKRAKLKQLSLLTMITCAALAWQHFQYDEAHAISPLFAQVMTAFLWFMVGLIARSSTLFLLSQRIDIAAEVFILDGKAHIALMNRLYAGPIEIRVVFELLEKVEKKAHAVAWRLALAETISLSSLPRREQKWKSANLYVEVPEKILKAWKKESTNNRLFMRVRATSVHPLTNFRGTTDSAIFSSLNLFHGSPSEASDAGTAGGVPSAVGTDAEPATARRRCNRVQGSAE